MADILNKGPAYWLPPDFLSDEDDDLLLCHNPTAPGGGRGDTYPHNYSSFPQKLPFNYSSLHQIQMDTDRLLLATATATAFSSTYFPCCPSKLISPLPGRIFKTPNGFLFPYHSPPPPFAPMNHLSAALYAGYTNNPLYDNQKFISPTINSRDVCCPQQKFMLQNRVIGYGGSEPMASSPYSAWPPLNPPPLLGGSCLREVFLNRSHQVKRKCAGTGVFLPRRYGTPLSDIQNKPAKRVDLVTPPNQVPARKNPVVRESPVIPNLDAAAMAARNKKVQLMNQQRRSNELCLPQEWAY